MTLDSVRIKLLVTRDEEHVELWVDGPCNTRILPSRAHSYTLLTLARLRTRDRAEGRLPAAARGWRSVADLCRMLAITQSRLNVDVYRIRRDLATLGITDATKVIERRRERRLLRIGTEQLEIGQVQYP